MSDINAQRLAWLHSVGSYDVDGYEWGIYRVKWENGQAAEVWQTNADFSDLDKAAGLAAPVAPRTGEEVDAARFRRMVGVVRCSIKGVMLDDTSGLEQWRSAVDRIATPPAPAKGEEAKRHTDFVIREVLAELNAIDTAVEHWIEDKQPRSQLLRSITDGIRSLLAATAPTATAELSDLPIRGVRVEGVTVIVSVKGGNDAARFVCGALVEGMAKAQTLGQRLTQCMHCGRLEDPGARPCAIGAPQRPVAAEAAPAPGVEGPGDLLTVANIEPEDGGATLTLLAADLGDLTDIVGEQPETYTVRIAAMTRVEFEALGEFDGF